MSDFLDYYRKDPNNLSFWFPKIKDCGIAVPKTFIFSPPEKVVEAYFMDDIEKDRETVFEYVKDEILPILPMEMSVLFVKNGTFSNKYDFSDCRVMKIAQYLTEKIINQNHTAAMYDAGGLSEIVIRGFIGTLPYIRENIPCIYNGMPLRPEFRIFYDFDKKELLYSVNYWDYEYCHEAIERNITDGIVYNEVYPEIEKFYNEHYKEVENMVLKCMENVQLTGKWSVDIMYDEESDMYYLIDMAVAEQSAYWKQSK